MHKTRIELRRWYLMKDCNGKKLRTKKRYMFP